MIAKIIIKRSFVGDKIPQIVALLNELRSRAMNQTGYISGETLARSDAPNYMVVIASLTNACDKTTAMASISGSGDCASLNVPPWRRFS